MLKCTWTKKKSNHKMIIRPKKPNSEFYYNKINLISRLNNRYYKKNNKQLLYCFYMVIGDKTHAGYN